MVLSVIIPVYNEERSVEAILHKVFSVVPRKEVIVINDCSSDRTKERINAVEAQFRAKPEAFPYMQNFRVVHKERNEGKGAAIRTAVPLATGDVVLIQDADLEVNPDEYPRLLEPFEIHKADIVFGSRFQMAGTRRVFKTHRYLANRFLTILSNLLSGMYITDMETCYKVFRREVIQSFTLKSDRFGIEPELAAYAAKSRSIIYEVPISYTPRDHSQGKKLKWWDGVKAILAIIRFNLFS